MNYSLGNMLSGGMLAGLDMDARAYIAAVRATGVSVSATQVTAINNFYKNCKSDGYYTSLKRFFLPIWSNASANAIDLIGLTSGTFVGGVTHSSGFVRFNGTTGYFRDNATVIAHGMTASTAHAMALVYNNPATAADFARFYGAYDTVDATKEITAFSVTSASQSQSRIYGVIAAVNVNSVAVSLQEGILLANRSSTTDHRYKISKTAGFFIDGQIANLSSSTPPAAKMAWATRNSNLDVPNTFYPADYGAMSVGISIGNNALLNTYISRVKTLWETCTGLTLP